LAKQEERKIQNAVNDAVDNRNIEIAKEMKLAKEPIDKIIKFTGLSKDQIDKL